MPWAHWIRAFLILLLVLIALILVRYDASGERVIEAGGKFTTPQDGSDWPKTTSTLMPK